MNKRIDLTNLNGFPLDEDAVDFLQSSYRTAFGAIAQLCGSKVILYGVQVVAGNVSAGWIAYNGELIPFIGGAVAAKVTITEASASAVFEDNIARDVFFTKTATVGPVGDFDFTDLVPLLSLQNIWRPGDIKERICDQAYIDTNFDVNGFGLNAEIGWRRLDIAYPATAGRVMVTLNPADPDFDHVGDISGEKTHTLTTNEMPSHGHSIITSNSGPAINDGADPARANATGTVNTRGAAGAGKSIGLTGGGAAHNNLQPSYAILKLVKL